MFGNSDGIALNDVVKYTLGIKIKNSRFSVNKSQFLENATIEIWRTRVCCIEPCDLKWSLEVISTVLDQISEKIHQLATTIRYDTIEEFNVDSKAEYTA